MFTADKLRKIKPTSSYQSRLEKSVKQGIKSNKRFIKRRLIKAQKRDEKSYQFTVEVPDEFKTVDYCEAYVEHYQNLGFEVDTTDSVVYDRFYITLFW